MQMDRRISSGALIAVLCVYAVAFVGCGASEESEMWNDVRSIGAQAQTQARVAEMPPEVGHRLVADLLQRTLESYPNASEELREVVRTIQQGEARLAAGEVRGAEAEELRDRHGEYWSYLVKGELPPEYQ